MTTHSIPVGPTIHFAVLELLQEVLLASEGSVRDRLLGLEHRLRCHDDSRKVFLIAVLHEAAHAQLPGGVDPGPHLVKYYVEEYFKVFYDRKIGSLTGHTVEFTDVLPVVAWAVLVEILGSTETEKRLRARVDLLSATTAQSTAYIMAACQIACGVCAGNVFAPGIYTEIAKTLDGAQVACDEDTEKEHVWN